MTLEQNSLTTWEPSADQIAVARYRASGYTQARASEETGVSVRTITRWENEQPDFVALVYHMRADMMRSLEPKLGRLMDLAAEVLIKAMEGGLEGDDPRVQLARELSRDTSFRLLRARAAVAVRDADRRLAEATGGDAA